MEREDLICAAILKSPFFSTDNDLEVVYPIPKGDSYAQLVLSQNGWDMFIRPYDLVNVSVLQDVRQEAVFPCLTKQKGTKELKLYLISHEYDFNRGIKMESRTVGGRFVFEFSKKTNMAILLAIAEEPVYTERLGLYGGWVHFDFIEMSSYLLCTVRVIRRYTIRCSYSRVPIHSDCRCSESENL